MCNHLNITDIIKCIDKNGPVLSMWEGNKHGEKGTQRAKKVLLNQKGIFCGVMIAKTT